jgi:predicted phosphodiesterase
MFAVLSDVHANLEALNSVLKDIKSRGISDIFFLGDAVGYGPNPKETLYILKDISKVFVAGNHDKAVVEPGLEPYLMTSQGRRLSGQGITSMTGLRLY